MSYIAKKLSGITKTGPSPNAWTLNNVTPTFLPYNRVLLTELITRNPSAIRFNHDGTRSFVISTNSNNIYEYEVYIPWDVNSFAFLTQHDMAGQSTFLIGLFFGNDGKKLYTVDPADIIYEFTLQTPWDISTKTLVNSLNLAATDNAISSITFKPDGTRMYIPMSQTDKILEYYLPIPWDLSSAILNIQFRVPNGTAQQPFDMVIKDDGTEFWLSISNAPTSTTVPSLRTFKMAVPWDIGSAYENTLNSFTTRMLIGGFSFNSDGQRLISTNLSRKTVSQHQLTENYDLSTTTFINPPRGVFQFSGLSNSRRNIFFRNDGARMYIADIGAVIEEYHLSRKWDITSLQFIQNFNVSEQEGDPSGVFFKNDGSSMYIVGTVNDTIFQYTLSSPWDVSSATLNTSLSLNAQDSSMVTIFFNNTGDKMFALGAANDSVYEYTLSTPWLVSSATFIQQFSIADKITVPTSLHFNPDGTKMFVMGISSISIHEYTLSTPWDISSSIFSQQYTPINEDISLFGLFFRSDGERIYIYSENPSSIFEYTVN